MMKAEFKDNEESENPTLDKLVEPDTDLKNWLVEYVGAKHSPEDQDVTVGMIVETMAEEFPEFLLAVAEENWVRGYQQAFYDIRGSLEKDVDDNEQQT
jgi:hypothetical protein